MTSLWLIPQSQSVVTYCNTGHLAATDIRDRYDAYAEVLDAYGLEPGVFLPALNNVESGIAWDADDLLRHGRPDALVAATDRNAFSALRVLAAAGVRSPDDILLTGFDNLDEASLHHPSWPPSASRWRR